MTTTRSRLVFADLDGTLIDHDQSVPASAARACRRLTENGHRLFMCTGRSMPEIYPWLWELGFSGAVTGAGGYIVAEGAVLRDRRIAREQIEELTELWRRFDGMWIWQGPEAMHPRPGFLESFVAGAGNGDGSWRAYAESIAPSIREGLPESTTKCTVYLPAGRVQVEELRALVPVGIQVISGSIPSGRTMVVEAYPDDVTKGHGLKLVADHYDVELSRTVAIGDSMNDIDALATAGTGIAMGGASPEVVLAADLLAPALEDDGFARALKAADLI